MVMTLFFMTVSLLPGSNYEGKQDKVRCLGRPHGRFTLVIKVLEWNGQTGRSKK
jgi:hypothetical protein